MDNLDEVSEAAERYRRRLGEAAPIFPYLGMIGLAVALREATERSELLTIDTLGARLGITPPADAQPRP